MEGAAPDTTGAATPAKASTKFLPVTRRDLLEVLVRETDLPEADREDGARLGTLLTHVFHFLFHQELRSLKGDYFPFDPDTVNRPIRPFEPAELATRARRLVERFEHVLGRANYQRLNEDELNELLSQTSPWGLKLRVDLSQFEQFCLYYRGNGEGERAFRDWTTLFRRRSVRFPVFDRLALLAQFKDGTALPAEIEPRFIYLKLFKKIPRTDLEMLFPNTVPQMKLFDKLKVALPLIGGTGTTLFKIIVAAAFHLWLAVMLIIGFLGYAVKTFLGYLRVKEKYQGVLVSNLYFNSLDNNLGVIHNLIDQAEEEEVKEALLAYFFLATEPDLGVDEKTLDQRIESFLAERFDVRMNFEAPDALDKLKRLGLLETGEDGRLAVPSLKEALRRLDTAWDGYFEYAG